MAADDTDTQTAAPPPSAPASPDMIAQAMRLAQQLAPQPIQPDTTPAQGGIVGLLGRIGSALAGGSVTDVMSPAQRERAGIRALGDFGTSLMAGSGYYPGKPMFGGLAQGFQGAEASERGSEEQVASQLGAQQDYQTKQAALRLKALQDALPLLTLDQQSRQAAAARALAGGGGGPAVPGTASGAGTPGGGGIALGMRQNNPLNLTFAGQPGAQPGHGNRFATFSDLPSGVAATADQLALYQTQHGINTVQDAVKRWVSDPKADLTSYTADVANALGVKPTDKIDLTDPTVQQKFILAAQPHESAGGGAVLNPADVAKGVQLAAANRGQTVQAPPAPYNVATSGTAVPGPPGGTAGAPAAPLPLPPVPPADTSQAVTPPPPAQPVAPTHPDIPVPGGGVISHPGEFADYRAKQFVPPTGEDFSPNLAPEDQQKFAIRAQGLQLKQQQIGTTLMPADQSKALIEVKQQQADLAAEQQAAIAAKRLAAATATTKYNEGQQKDIQTRYDAAAAAYNTAAQGSLTSQQKIAEINATSDAQAAGKSLEAINTSTAGAQDVVNQSEMARQLSQTAGTPGFLALWPKVADNLVRAGLLSQDEVKQLGAQRGLDAVSNKLILALKSQAGFSRFTNQDLTFLQNTAPSSFTPEQLRTPMLAAIQTAAQRQVQYGHIVNSLHAGGMPVWQAQQEADKQLGSIIPKTPSLDTIADPSAKLAAQGQWVTQNVPVGSFYLKPNGKLGIRGQQSQAGQ